MEHNTLIYSLVIYGLYFMSVLIFSLLLYGILLRFVRTLGIRQPGDMIIRWSAASKPSLGGIVFYIAFILSIACNGMFFGGEALLFNKQMIGILFASGMAFLMGLSDDAFNTKPLLKLGTQMACGVILYLTGTVINIFPQLWLNATITILWVVGIMNAINMLDNMDAIAGVISTSIISTCLIICWMQGSLNNVLVMVMTGVLAAVIGFLAYNWNPSRLYMGDAGSQFLGFFLATIGIIYLWNHNIPDGIVNVSKQTTLAVLAFILPIIDTTTVVVNRILRKQRPWVGGRDHTTHFLSYIGLSDRQVAGLMIVISSVSLIFSFFIVRFVHDWSPWYTAIFSGYFILLFIFIYSTTRMKSTRKKFEETEQQINERHGLESGK